MTRIALLALSVFTLARAFPAAGQTITGQWMIDPSPKAGKILLTLHRSVEHSEMTSTSDYSMDQLRGLARPQMDSTSGEAVHFEIPRNAGTLACDGFFRAGKGSGAFTFSPSQNFVSEMQSLGYNGLSTETVFSMAVHDVTSAYARELRSLGVNPGSSDGLVSMRIHDVTTDFVRDLKGMGYHPSTDDLVSLRIHGATSEYVKQVKGLGFNPSLDQLVTMRIHGVTPEYIQRVKARGIKNLTIDQLVNLRIHGIVD